MVSARTHWLEIIKEMSRSVTPRHLIRISAAHGAEELLSPPNDRTRSGASAFQAGFLATVPRIKYRKLKRNHALFVNALR